MADERLQGRWPMLACVGLAFFFLTGSTFTSLAVVLYRMTAELHWSQAQAGLSFSLLGFFCGISSPLPAIAIARIGVRWTMVAGAAVLALGFLLAAFSYGIAEFYFGICLVGCAFSLMAPVPGMYLLPRWFGAHAPRIIGFYFMAGSFGGVFGPILVNASVAWTGSWRLHWMLMAAAASLLALICGLFVRDLAVPLPMPEEVRTPDAHGSVTNLRAAARTPAFIATAFAMLVVQTALTVANYALVGHMIHLGATPSRAAYAIAALALAGTIAKGVAGALAENVHPLLMLLASLVLSGAAFALLGSTVSLPLITFASALFGAGWGVAWLSAHLFLLRCFGRELTPALVALATTITTAAVIAPLSAGILADRTGGFSAIFLIVAGMFLLAMLSTLTIRRSTPRLQGSPA